MKIYRNNLQDGNSEAKPTQTKTDSSGCFRIYRYELATSSPTWHLRKGLVIESDIGWGEIAPLPGFSKESLEEAEREILDYLANPNGPYPKLPSVRFGLTSALRPFSRAPLKIPLALLNEPRPQFSTLKLKLGHLSLPDAIQKVRALKGSYRLRLDCNRAWTLDEALFFASHFSPSDFEYLEEPVRTLTDLFRFSEMTQFPIAVDESIGSDAIFKIPTLKALVVKPTLVGSLPSFPLPTVLSSSYESSLGILLIARLFEKMPDHAPLPGLDTFRFFQEDLLLSPLKTENGFLIWEGCTGCPIDKNRLCAL
jgi:O-succinylbenzoate synthase